MQSTKPTWDGPAYVSVFLCRHRKHSKSPWAYSDLFRTVEEAAKFGISMVSSKGDSESEATLAFVAEIKDGIKTLLLDHVYPRTSKNIIVRYEELLGIFEEENRAKTEGDR